MELIAQNDTSYPRVLLKYLGDNAPLVITAIGNIDILQNKTLALFCSSQCPGHIIIKTYDTMKEIRAAGTTVISGFHSPMEKECMNILLKGSQPIVICPARSLDGMRIKPELRKPLDDGRLLILSPFEAKYNRPSAERAAYRNQFVAAIADEIFIPHAAPGGKLSRFTLEISGWNKAIRTFI